LRTIFDVGVIVNNYKNSPCPSNIQYTVHACKTDNLQVVIFQWQKIRPQYVTMQEFHYAKRQTKSTTSCFRAPVRIALSSRKKYVRVNILFLSMMIQLEGVLFWFSITIAARGTAAAE